MSKSALKYQLDPEAYLTAPVEPKESFKQVGKHLKQLSEEMDIGSILEVGGASGDFLFWLSHQVHIPRIALLDPASHLTGMAQERMPNAEIYTLYLSDFLALDIPPFDIVTCLGTIAIFDDLEPVVHDLLSLVAKGGRLVIHEAVNDFGVDVIQKFRRVRSLGDNADWEVGLNIWSRETWVHAVHKVNPDAQVTFSDFNMPFDLAPQPETMRAWTTSVESNPYQLMVGTGQLLNFKLIEVVLPS